MKRIRPTHRGRPVHYWAIPVLLALLLSGCAPSTGPRTPVVPSGPEANNTPTAEATLAAPLATATAQPTAAPVMYGPNPQDFPAGVNPLTGQPFADPSLLKVPALLVSISDFPVTARPQAGLSFAPYVYEFSITEGQTRFLTTFYGQYPAPEIPIQGNCEVRQGIFQQTGVLLGNRLWFDSNKNGIQDAQEPGIGGICVNLFDASGQLIDKTTTDSNGYYGFNVKPQQTYSVEFLKPSYLDFTRPNLGNEDDDSDANPATGRTAPIQVAQDDMRSTDAGLFPNSSFATPTPNAKTDPKPQVGPVRSGRLLYGYIANFMQDSCLIYAFASEEVLPLIPHCAFVTHEVSGGGFMLDISRLKAIAQENARNTASRPFNYTSNVYSDIVPSGGHPALQINEFFATLNQSRWSYDPLYQAYLRYTDMADKNAPGVLHADVDRLTGRQIHFENVIVVMADTDVVSPTNIDIHLEQGQQGYAYLFRDGQMFPIRWNTLSGDYEKQTGLRRPIRFVNNDGSPAALKPGHTWVIIVTPFSTVKETQPGAYLVAYAAPEGEAR